MENNIPKMVISKTKIVMDGYILGRPFFSLWDRWKHLRNRSIVIGLIGGRGSGKSNSASRILVVDYLLKKRNVWSNLPIKVDLITPEGCVPLRSIDIEDGLDISSCENGVVFLDEVNQGYADSWRSMSNDSLEFAYEAQQIRKSKLDLIWTTQSESFTNPRLRFQTDIIIKCADISLPPFNKKVGIGEFCQWEIWDYSGILTGKLNVVKTKETPVIFGKPWWHAFDTKKKQIDYKQKMADDETKKAEYHQIAEEIANYIRDTGSVDKGYIWKKWNITTRWEQIHVGTILSQEFDIVNNYNRRRYKVNQEAFVE